MDTSGIDRMIEIEKKYRLTGSQRDDTVRALETSGAVFVREDEEENTIYGGPLLADGAIVRIRRTQDTSLLTYKRRVESEFDVKQQVELETEVTDADAVDAIVRELGLQPNLVYEKRRRIWTFRESEIVIDELPFGEYMEIEGSVTAIKEAEMLLGLDDLETEHETYPRLTARLGKKVGDVVEARFI